MKTYELSFKKPVSIHELLELVEKFTGAKKHVPQMGVKNKYFTVHFPGLIKLGFDVHPGPDYTWRKWPCDFEECFKRTSKSFRIHVREGELHESVIDRINKKVNEDKDMA